MPTKIADSADHIEDLPPLTAAELLLFSIDKRSGRLADAAEGIDELTAQVSRLADAFESIAATLNCLTENVEGADGVSRCVVRTRDTVPNALSQRDDHESD
jgi:methyl-accepting chemotaxis protein